MKSLEARIAPALVNPFPLGSVDGANGLQVSGIGASGFGERPAAVAGDVNGDGFEDAIFGASGINAAFVVFGRADGFPADLDVTTVDGTNGFRIDGTTASTQFGQSVGRAGDVNGDGFADVVVGAFNEKIGANNNAGAAYVVFGKASFGAPVSIASLDGSNGFKLSGAANNQAASEVGTAGDLNGDGFDDVVVGEIGADFRGSNSGAAYVIFGRAAGFAANTSLSTLNGPNGFRINGAAASDFFGDKPSSAGDVNGDGFGDLIVGASSADANGANSGAAYVIFGRSSFAASLDVSSLNGANGFRLRGAAAGDFAGRSVAGGGDVNGDGFADVVVGASAAKVNGAVSGAAYVVFGKGTPFAANLSLSTLDGTDGVRLLGEAANSYTGYSVHLADDVNGDGFDDVIIGAPNNLSSTAYVVYGPPAFGASMALADLDGTTGVKLQRAANNDSSGSNVAAGDVNGDGLADIVISRFGGGHIVFGSPSPAVTQFGDKTANTLTGTGADDTLVAGAANDMLIGSGGADVLRGGQGDDLLAISDLGFRPIVGGTGTDTLRLDGAGLALDLTTPGNTALGSIERIDLNGTGANTLTLNFLEVLNLSPTSNTLTVLGGADDLVNLGPNWFRGVPENIGGTDFLVLHHGAATLKIAADVPTSTIAGWSLPHQNGERAFTINGTAGNLGQFGQFAASAGDVNGDGFEDVIIGDNYALVGGVKRGAAYVVFGKAGGFTPTLEASALNGANGFRITKLGAAAGDAFGFRVNGAGDVNGDGFADVLVSDSKDDAAASNAGAVWVIFGKSGPFTADLDVSTITGANGFKITGEAANHYLGERVSGAGDVNGDGFADLVVSAPSSSPNGSHSGAAYVVFGKTSFATTLPLASLDGFNGFRLNGEAAGHFAGNRLAAAGDVNGDGFGDLLVGAPSADPHGADSGAAYLVFGKAGGFAAKINLSSLNGTTGVRFEGAITFDSAGTVGAAGDINGDGLDDIVIGAVGVDLPTANAGAAYIVFGKTTPFAAKVPLASLTPAAGFRVIGEGFFDYAGGSVTAAGDVNGDGFDDVLISAPYSNFSGPGSGGAYVLLGQAGFNGNFSLAEIDGQNLGFKLDGVCSTSEVLSVGDVNGDGFDDIIYGERAGSVSRAGYGPGVVHVFFGLDTGAVTHAGDANANTLTGDGNANVFVAGQADDTVALNGGADSARGGQGDDLFKINGLDFRRIVAGTGTDTLQLDAAIPALDLTALRDAKLKGLERIDLTGSGANTLTLSVREVVNLSPNSNTLTVIGDAGDTVNFGQGWVREPDTMIGGQPFQVFTSLNGAASLRISAAVTHPLPSGYTLPFFDGAPGLTINGATAADEARIVGSAGDVNGDGFDDFLIGAPKASPNGAKSGAAYVVFGNAGPFTSPVELSALNGMNGFALRGEAANDYAGYSLSAAGDFNGDGFADVLIGSSRVAAAGQAGTAYLIFGKASFAPVIELSTLGGADGFKLRATAPSSFVSVRVGAAGDVNGDGFSDVVIGAPQFTSGGVTQKGLASVVFGRAAAPAAPLDLATLNGTDGFTIAGTKTGEFLGTSVSGGDVNADGFSDVIVGVGPFAGATAVVYGHAGSFLPTILDSTLTGTAGFTVTGSTVKSVSAAGDVNRDGIADLIVGASTEGAGGAAFVVFGKTGTTFGSKVDLTKLNGANGFQIAGRVAGGSLGESVSAAGDVNGDGFDDVLVGAAFTEQRGFQNGEAYVVFGKGTGFAASINVGMLDGTNGLVLSGTESGVRAGRRVSAAGDVNGDGFDDVLVGTYGPFTAGPGGVTSRGRDFLVFGFDTGAVTQRGGSGDEMFTATAGADVIVAGQGNDTMLNAGFQDILRGGQGDDLFSVSGGFVKRFVGGNGFDTLELAPGGDFSLLLDLTKRAAAFTGFEQVDLGPGKNSLKLDLLGVVNLSTTSNTLVVRTDGDDFVDIGSGWILQGNEVIGGESFNVFKQGAATLKVQENSLAVTLVNATTATFTDVDGDLATVKVSKGTLSFADFTLAPAGTVGGFQLQKVNFSDDGAEFSGANLSITAARTALGGDGRVNVGKIEATNLDLGKVTIEGDLGALSAGAGSANTPGLVSLDVGSLGLFGLSTQAPGGTLSVAVSGTVGTLDVATDVVGMAIVASIPVGSLNPLVFGKITIGGSLRGDTVSGGQAGLHAFGNVGSIEIGGDIRSGQAAVFDIIGGAGEIGSFKLGGSLVRVSGANAESATITFGKVGAMTIGGDIDGGKIFASNEIKSLAVSGSVLNARVLAGYIFNGAASNADATIGAVTVNGDWVASDLVAGARTIDPLFGNGQDVLITSGSPAVPGGDPAKVAKITSITIKGEAIGTPGGSDHFGFVAEEIGSFTVGGTKFPLTAGGRNDLTGLYVGSTLDVKVREVNTTAPAIDPPLGGGGGTVLQLSSLNGSTGFRFDGAESADAAGSSVAAAGDVNDDGFDDVIVGAPFGGANNKGEAYVVFGNAAGFDPAIDPADLDGTTGFRIFNSAPQGIASPQLGLAVGGVGDVNQDGFDDVIVGSIVNEGASGSREEVFVIFGMGTAFGASLDVTTLTGAAGFKVTRTLEVDPGGIFNHMSVSGAGDVNGDTFDDLVIGAVNADFAGQNFGSAFVVFSPGAVAPASIDMGALDGMTGFRVDGPSTNAFLGYSVSAARDLNSDGFDDVVLGAPTAAIGGDLPGSGYVIFGKDTAFAASFNTSALDGANGFRIPGIDPGSYTGDTVSGGGDVNGDGLDDIVIGAPYAGTNDPGAAYVVFGRKTAMVGNFPADFSLASLDGTNGFKLTGDSANGLAGRAAIAGDLNGDGLDDIVVGARGLEPTDEGPKGGGYVVFGRAPPPANIPLGSLNSSDGFKFLGVAEDDEAGTSVSGAGDVNGDALADFIVGATGTVSGSAYLVFGSVTLQPLTFAPDNKTAFFTDVDGDRVSVKTSLGAFNPDGSEFTRVAVAGFSGSQLQKLKLGAGFTLANITITAARGANGGDGFVNVGFIDASTVDLGIVTVEGDLGQLDVGNGDPLKPAVANLTVQSLGRLGLSTQVTTGASLESNIKGKLGALTVKSDVVGAFVNVAGSVDGENDDTGAINIAGSLRGGSAENSGTIFAADDIASAKIGQGIFGGAGAHSGSIESGGKIGSVAIGQGLRSGAGLVSGSLVAGTVLGAVTIGGDISGGRIFARGNLSPATDALALAIKSLTIDGNVFNADILAGYDRNGAAANGDVQIGAVKVGRDWMASDLAAGVKTGADGFFGNGDELIPSVTPIISRIASILISGQALGSTAPGDHFGFVAEEIGFFTIGATKFPLSAGPGNDLAGLLVGATSDLRVREL